LHKLGFVQLPAFILPGLYCIRIAMSFKSHTCISMCYRWTDSVARITGTAWCAILQI